MTYLKQYAKFYKKMIAYDEILKDLKPLAQKELKKQPDQKAITGGVEFHMTSKVTKEYPQVITEAIKILREDASGKGLVKEKTVPTFDAYIPKSVKESVLSKDVNDYRKYFFDGVGT